MNTPVYKQREEEYMKKYNIPLHVAHHDTHKRALILAIMRQDELTPRDMADRLGVRLEDFHAYTAQQEPFGGPVGTMVARYLAVPVRHWNKGQVLGTDKTPGHRKGG
jgi:hypothetical protein